MQQTKANETKAWFTAFYNTQPGNIFSRFCNSQRKLGAEQSWLANVGDWSFVTAGPRLWNTLQISISILTKTVNQPDQAVVTSHYFILWLGPEVGGHLALWHSSPRALVTTVVSRVVLRRVRNCWSYYYSAILFCTMMVHVTRAVNCTSFNCVKHQRSQVHISPLLLHTNTNSACPCHQLMSTSES